METLYAGKCACGAVVFTCHAVPLAMYNCHCHGCQKINGAPYSAMLVLPAPEVKITGEYITIKSRVPDDPHPWRTFCGHCHAMLFAYSDAMPEVILINASALDDPDRFCPVADIWTAHMQSWVHLDRHIPKVLKAPPVLGENFL